MSNRVKGLYGNVNFGLMNLLTGFKPYGENNVLTYGDMIAHMELILTLAIDDYKKWTDRINALARDNNIIKESPLKSEINIITQFGLPAYEDMIQRYADKLDVINSELEQTSQVDVNGALYEATLLLLQIITLKEQEHLQPIHSLEKVYMIQKGKQTKAKERNAAIAGLKTIDAIISYVNSNYSHWYKDWVAYNKSKNNKDHEKYSLVPLHFRNWFKKNYLTTPTKLICSVEFYWKYNKETTENSFIRKKLQKI